MKKLNPFCLLLFLLASCSKSAQNVERATEVFATSVMSKKEIEKYRYESFWGAETCSGEWLGFTGTWSYIRKQHKNSVTYKVTLKGWAYDANGVKVKDISKENIVYNPGSGIAVFTIYGKTMTTKGGGYIEATVKAIRNVETGEEDVDVAVVYKCN